MMCMGPNGDVDIEDLLDSKFKSFQSQIHFSHAPKNQTTPKGKMKDDTASTTLSQKKKFQAAKTMNHGLRRRTVIEYKIFVIIALLLVATNKTNVLLVQGFVGRIPLSIQNTNNAKIQGTSFLQQQPQTVATSKGYRTKVSQLKLSQSSAEDSASTTEPRNSSSTNNNNNNSSSTNNNNNSYPRRKKAVPATSRRPQIQQQQQRQPQRRRPTSNTSNPRRRNNGFQPSHPNPSTFQAALKSIQQLQSPTDMQVWIQQQQQQHQRNEAPSIQEHETFSKTFNITKWNPRSQVDFVKALQETRDYPAMLTFLQILPRPNLKVCTTAIFALALCPNPRYRRQAVSILSLMDYHHVEPTALTFIALLGAVDGPVATSRLLQRFESYKSVEWNAEVYHSAIYACRRDDANGSSNSNEQERGEKDWQLALNLLQGMRRKRIEPTLKTYHAVLQVLSRAGKVQMARSILLQLQNTPDLEADEKIWASAINVCAEAGDMVGAIEFLKRMQSSGKSPNLYHCSALLKAFKQAGNDQLALYALSMMLGERYALAPITAQEKEKGLQFDLPMVPPDLIAINTVIAACAKAGNYDDARRIFDRLQDGDFVDPRTQRILKADRISYHNLLLACQEPESAGEIILEMRNSGNERIRPTNVTYSHAITVCQRTEIPDVEGAEFFLEWAIEDGIQPTVYMFAPAIWAAQKSGDSVTALELFVLMEDFGCAPNEVAFNGVLSALSDSGDVDHAMLIFDEMKSRNIRLSATAYKHLVLGIQSVESLDQKRDNLESILSLMDESEHNSHVAWPIYEALIATYGAMQDVDKAIETFHSIQGRTTAPCLRAVLFACSLSKPPRWQEAVSILHTSDIVEDSNGPGRIDQVALGNSIVACSKANEFQEALTLLQLYGASPQESRARSENSVSPVAINSLIGACGRSMRPDLALMLVNTMDSEYGVTPDERSYRSAIIAFNRAQYTLSKNGPDSDDERSMFQWWECSLSLLRRMREEGLVPDVTAYSASISACESAGEWQRALGILQMMMDDDSSLDESDNSLLNRYCFNAAISACEKGNAWVEALELYERMMDTGGPILPNAVTLNSLLEALDKAGQKELAQSKYREAFQKKFVNPWRETKDSNGNAIRAMDFHRFSAAMAKAATRDLLEGLLIKDAKGIDASKEVVIITGKGLRSENQPILKASTLEVFSKEYGVEAESVLDNEGRIILTSNAIKSFLQRNKW